MAGDISRKTGQWKVMARQKKNKEEKDEKKAPGVGTTDAAQVKAHSFSSRTRS